MKTVRKRMSWFGYALALLLVVSSFISTAQDEKKKPPVKVLESRVSDKLSGKPIAGASVEVYKNGSLLETKPVASNGKYKISALELDHNYKIVFKAPGYVSRFIEVDLKNIPLEDVFGKGWEVPLDMTLPEKLPDLDFTPVENKITSTLKYEKSTGEVEFNRNQLEAYNKELDKVLKKVEEAKKAEEKKKQENDLKYNAAMKAADEAVKKDDYAGAIAKYNEALTYREKDPSATAKIKETEAKKVEFEKKTMAEKEYKSNYDIAEAKFKQKDYDGAIEAYRKAKEYKADPALDKKIKEAEAAKVNDAKAMKDKEYNDFVAAGDKAYTAKDYGNARDNYKKAMAVKADPGIQKKITEIETLMKKQIEDEAKYDQFLVDGNKAMLNSKWDDAIKNFQSALTVRADSKEAKEGLEKANAEKAKASANAAAELKKQQEFDAAVKQGDAAMTAKKFDDAIAAYDKALGIKDDAGAKTKKDAAIAAKKSAEDAANAAKEKERLEAEYKQAMADGDKMVAAKDYDNAIASYQKALTAKAGDKAATDKIASTKKLQGDMAEAQKKEKEYNDLRAEADADFNAGKYEDAVTKYMKAKTYKSDKYLDDQIAKANKAIEDKKANEAKRGAFETTIAQGDEELGAKTFDAAIATYQKALAMKFDDALANSKIDAAKKQKEDYLKEQQDIANAAKKKEFDAVIAQGDKELTAKTFDVAITTYQKALAMKIDDATANAKIDEARKQKQAALDEAKNKAEQEKIQAEFLALVKKGDDEMGKKNFVGAISNYEAALNKKDDASVQTKLADAKKQKEDAEKALANAQEREAKYKEHMTNGEAAFKSKDLTTASAEFQAALDLKNGDKPATDKLNAVKALLAEEQKKQKDYEGFMAKGQTELDGEKFDVSIATFTSALTVKPGDPGALAKIEEAKQKKIDWQNKQNQAAANAANKKKYDEALAKGDAEHTAGKFKEAIDHFNEALVLIPNDAVAEARIAKSKAEMEKREKELQAQYDKIMAQADKDFAAENYKDAKEYYERYLKFDKTNSHAIERVKESEAKIKEKELADAAYAKKKVEFDALVLKGDIDVKAKKYKEAIGFYNQALAVIPDEPNATKKRDDAQRIMDGAHDAEVHKKFDAEIAKGDAEHNAGKFKEAIDHYNAALVVIPNDKTAEARIAKSQAEMEKREKELQDQYAKIMAQADKDFDATNYADAKGYYERYLKFDKNNSHAVERIKECDIKIKEKQLADANYAKKKTEYDALIALGDAEVKQKKYDAAIATFTKAMGVLPDDLLAPKKRDDAQRMKDDLANADVMAKYNDAMNKGNTEANAGKFDEAITHYERALEVKPGDATAEAKIADAKARKEKRKTELEEQFAKILAQADKDFNAGNYQDAIGYYERYLGFNKDHAYSKTQIAEAKKLMVANADMAAKKKKYQELIDAGDKLVTGRKFDDGIVQYNNALTYIPNDPVALEKIEYAKKLKLDAINAAKNAAEAKEMQAKYQVAFDAGVAASDAGTFKLAIDKFEEALGYKPGDKPATDWLAKVRKRYNDEIAERDVMYNQIITQADKDFDASNFSDALGYYKRAAGFKPNEQYPKDRIAECENRLRMAKRKHHEIKPEGEIVTNQTVLDALKMVEEAKRQEKFEEEQRFVRMRDEKAALDSAYLANNANNRFENKAALDKKQEEIVQFKDRGEHEENAENYKAINDAQREYNTQQTSQNAKNVYENKKQIDQNQQDLNQMFIGQDIYRQYKIDSTADFIDTRNTVLREKGKDQTYSGYQQQKEYDEYTFNQTQLFKGMDETYRGYKVDSIKDYKDQRDEAYRNALHKDNSIAFDNQKKLEADEDNRSELYRDMDKQYRMYKVDSIADFKDQRDEAYRNAMHKDNSIAYDNQQKLNAEADARKDLYESMDKNYRGYKVDSIKDYKDIRDEQYRQALHRDNSIAYDNQKNFEANADARVEYFKGMDENYRGYNVDSIKDYKDKRDEAYRNAMHKDNSIAYDNQQKINADADARKDLYESLDKNYRGYKVDSVKAYKDSRDDAYQAAAKNNNQNVYDQQQKFNKESDQRSVDNTKGSENYLEHGEEFIKKADDKTKATEGFANTGDTKRMANNEKFKNTAPAEPKEYNTGYLSELAQELGDGIHQWTYNKLDDKGKTSEVVIRRIVVKANTANDYKMVINKWGQHYLKNGLTSNEYTWNVETGGTVIEHDK